MSIVLFRKGDSHIANGVACEIGTFEPDEMEWLLDQGWHNSVEDINNDAQKVEEESKQEEVQKNDEKAPDEVREQAKAAGIKGWENKRIKTLKAEMNEQQA